MSFIQAFNFSQGGGGGGLTLDGFKIDEFNQTTNFISGAVTLNLTHTPLEPQAVVLDYNGQRKRYGDAYSVAGNIVTILFADPYVTDYPDVPYFQVSYAY